jgi:hypothetical protein
VSSTVSAPAGRPPLKGTAVRISSRPVHLALVSGAAVLAVGAASAGGALADRVSSDSGSRVVVDATTASAEHSAGRDGYEGPGTERVPGEQRAGEGDEYEGPGTDRTAPPVYRAVTASSWRVVVPSATVYAVPGDTGTRTATISDRGADVAGTGRAATVGTADWYEVKVPGASTGWVVGTELERL